VNDNLLEIPEFSPYARGVLWEMWALDKGLFIVYDEETIYTYMYSRDHVTGIK